MADRPIGLTGKQASRLKNALRKIEGPGIGPGAPTGRIPREDPDGIWAKITGYAVASGVNHYAWTQQRPTVDGFDDWPGGLSGTTSEGYALNLEPDDAQLPATGNPVVWLQLVWEWDDDAEEWVRGFRFRYRHRGLIQVTFTLEAGWTPGTSADTSGDETTPPDFTYKWPVDVVTGIEIKKADGSQATGLSPAWNRNVGEFNPADHGTLYMDSSGNPQLWQVDETEVPCDPPE